jgi:hypothetical protein
MTLNGACRDLNAAERKVLACLLVPRFPGRDAIVAQLSRARVQVLDEDGSLGFDVPSDSEPAEVESRVPTEGTYQDADGITVHLLLHVVEGRIRELEIYKEDGSRVAISPADVVLDVFAP